MRKLLKGNYHPDLYVFQHGLWPFHSYVIRMDYPGLFNGSFEVARFRFLHDALRVARLLSQKLPPKPGAKGKEAPPPEERFCKDCRHYVPPVKSPSMTLLPDIPARCTHRKHVDPVDGKPTDAALARITPFEGNCGPDGKFWEPK